VWMEQGVGDQILFSTLLPELAQRGLEVVAEVDARLANLYRRGMPGVTFVTPPESQAAFASCDAQAALGSLPRLLRRDAADFARQPHSVMAADPARVREMRAAIGDGPAIAISWRSIQKGNRKALGERKSIPLEAFARLSADSGARLVVVQYGDTEEERKAFEERHPGVLVRIPGLDPFHDLDGLAAALAACGRVVTSSNVTAHLAGSIGKRTLLMYPGGVPPFHYWATDETGRCLWYPSVTIVTGPALRTWEALLARAAELLDPRAH